MVQFEFKSNLDLGRHPERSRFSGGVKDLARSATVFMTQITPLPAVAYVGTAALGCPPSEARPPF